MKIEKPEIITKAYYISCSRFPNVMVDVDHRFLDFVWCENAERSAVPCGEGVSHHHVISHPPPHEKKLNPFKFFAYHKKKGLRPLEQQPKKDMLGRHVSLLLRTPPYLFDL